MFISFKNLFLYNYNWKISNLVWYPLCFSTIQIFLAPGCIFKSFWFEEFILVLVSIFRSLYRGAEVYSCFYCFCLPPNQIYVYVEQTVQLLYINPWIDLILLIYFLNKNKNCRRGEVWSPFKFYTRKQHLYSFYPLKIFRDVKTENLRSYSGSRMIIIFIFHHNLSIQFVSTSQSTWEMFLKSMKLPRLSP